MNLIAYEVKVVVASVNKKQGYSLIIKNKQEKRVHDTDRYCPQDESIYIFSAQKQY